MRITTINNLLPILNLASGAELTTKRTKWHWTGRNERYVFVFIGLISKLPWFDHIYTSDCDLREKGFLKAWDLRSFSWRFSCKTDSEFLSTSLWYLTTSYYHRSLGAPQQDWWRGGSVWTDQSVGARALASWGCCSSGTAERSHLSRNHKYYEEFPLPGWGET